MTAFFVGLCRYVLVFLPLLIAVPLVAQPLDSLVGLAIEKHPSVAAVQNAIRQADARARSVGAWQAPGVGIQFNMLPPGNPNPFAKGETMLMVEQMIPLFGQNKAMARAMSAEAGVGEAELVSVRRALRVRVEQEYYTLWLLKRRVDINRDNRELASLLYRTAETNYEVGRAAQSDLFSITGEQERLNVEAREITEEIAEAQARLNTLLLRPVETPVSIADSVPSSVLPSFDELAGAILTHPDLQKMEAMAAMNRAEADAKESMLSPMLMVRGGVSYMPEGHPLRESALRDGLISSGGHGGSTSTSMDVMKFALSAGAMISIPIAPWSSAGPQAGAEAERLKAETAMLEREGMKQDMIAMLRTACSQAARAQFQVQYYEKTQLPLLEQTLASLRNDYANGRIPFSSVLNGYTMLGMARMERAMKQMEYAMALSMITQLTGVSL